MQADRTCVTDNGRRTVYQTEVRKKYVQNSGFWSWIFSQIPFARSGILKIPSGSTPCPRGFSKSPPGTGDLGENPLPKTRISYIYFLLLPVFFLSLA